MTNKDLPRARSATKADITEIIRLGSVMFGEAHIDTSGEAWREAAIDTLNRRLGVDVRVCVVEHPSEPGRLIAQAAGIIAERIPDPLNLSGNAGYVLWTVTDPEWRNQGLAREIMTALLDWFDSEGVSGVELHATPAGQPLYESLGFVHGDFPGLRRDRGGH